MLLFGGNVVSFEENATITLRLAGLRKLLRNPPVPYEVEQKTESLGSLLERSPHWISLKENVEIKSGGEPSNRTLMAGGVGF
jgi:hypothetical protein